jgi:serine/threonine protein kinase
VNPRVKPLRDGDPKNFQGWALKGFIGEGGQSTIYLAEKDGKTAALKMIRKEFLHNENAVSRFFTEIKNLEMLNHPNIARVLEVERSGSFLAIDFVDGPNLQQYLVESGPFSFEKWCKFAYGLAQTIDYCHSKGIIHKDISPQNIVIGENGPVLVDFGISYLEKDPRLTSVDETIGTPPFMSPEHFGISTPKEMDSFSLAGTLIFAATGHNPFFGETKSELKESILFSAPDFTGLSDEQIAILSPLLYKRPEQRLSLEEFSKLLSELISSIGQSSLIEKEFAKVKRESQKKLVQEKKSLSVKRRTLRNLISTVTLVSVLSIGVAAYAIFQIQNNADKDLSKSPSDIFSIVNLTADQQVKAAACKNLASFGDYEAAIATCKLPAELGDVWSQYSLGFSLQELGKATDGEKWVLKAAKKGLPEAMAGMAATEINRKNYLKALEWGKQSAESGNLVGVETVGISYAYLKQYDLAVEWYKRSWDLGDIQGARNLGYHYWFEFFDKSEASKWLKISAETKSSVEGATAFDYAEFLRREIKNYPESCYWYKKSADANYVEDMKNGTKAFQKYCSNLTDIPKTTPAPRINSVTPTPLATKKPIASSDSFKVSAPLSMNVEIDEIFGAAFINRLNYWVIPLTNSRGAKVPELTAIQFKLIGYPDAGWLAVPYKLKTDTSFGTVYAEVDDMLFSLIFKDQKYCPEFRVVREEGGKIVRIWNKGQPDCATDYNP